jgi:hypothetical protein
VTVEEHAQELIDVLRAPGAARLIASFHRDRQTVDGEEVETVSVDELDLYAMNPNHAGGFSYDLIEDGVETDAIEAAVVALVDERYAGKKASGRLLVDETDRIWGEGVHEEELDAETVTGLRVDL